MVRKILRKLFKASLKYNSKTELLMKDNNKKNYIAFLEAELETIITRIEETKSNKIKGNDMYSVGWNSACNTIIDDLKERMERMG